MYRDTRKRGEKVEKSRAEYFRQRREDKKNFSVYVDKDNAGQGTLERRKKKSFEWYRQVIATNGECLK